jgi:hypothetical protein
MQSIVPLLKSVYRTKQKSVKSAFVFFKQVSGVFMYCGLSYSNLGDGVLHAPVLMSVFMYTLCCVVFIKTNIAQMCLFCMALFLLSIFRIVQGKATFMTTFGLVPAKPGPERKFVVNFSSRQLEGITGYATINVKK